MADYEPNPLDLSGVALPPSIAELRELLARQAHEVWAKQRLAEGWTPGPRRDDTLKQHPDLVPYDQLPESEKEYDRKVSESTLAAMVALGYRIEPPVASSATATTARELPESIHALDLDALLSLWQSRAAGEWQRSPRPYQVVAERLLALGEPLLAYDATQEGRQQWPRDARLRQLEALALARSGATGSAQAILRELYAEGAVDEETVGMLARTEKDFGLGDADPARRRQHLERAARLYEEAFERHAGYWSGINAATLRVLLGEPERAASLARTVRDQCLGLLGGTDGSGRVSDYWPLATLGEACLVLGQVGAAAEWYARAAVLGRRRLGDLASTRRNARLLLDALACDRAPVEQALRMPSVALALPSVCAGVDDAALAHRLRAELAEADCLIGYCSLAGPADVVFGETVLERGGALSVVLPYDADRYLTDQTRAIDDPSWAERARGLLGRAASVVVASPHGGRTSAAEHEFLQLLLRGLARSHARRLDTRVVLFELRPETPASRASTSPVADVGHPTEIVAMLFGDAVHFSRLGEEEVVRFSDECMGSIGRLIAASQHAPIFTNTWGDGLFFVFRTVHDAGLFALELCELMNGTDWTTRGLPAELNLRVGLHAGPVFRWTDPITGRAGYMGTHISRAARIEPITPAGQVYASEAFAALSELIGASHDATAGVSRPELVCDYVGRTAQAKGYGTFPTYHVRRV